MERVFDMLPALLGRLIRVLRLRVGVPPGHPRDGTGQGTYRLRADRRYDSDVEAWWDATADYFQEEIAIGAGVDWTGLGYGDLDLLGDVEGGDILELGCGGGQCSVALAADGADVTGIDISSEQLAHARRLAADHGVDVEFAQGDVTDLGAFPDESYDVGFNSWVFQWVGDLAACFAETHRVLRPGGRFVFSMPHPVYELADAESHRITDSYFDTGRQETTHDEVDVDQVTSRHTVGGIVTDLVRAGFDVERMHEPGTPDPSDHEPGPWDEFTPELMSKLPAVLVVEARKRPEPSA